MPHSAPWKQSDEYQPTENLCPGRTAAVVVCARRTGAESSELPYMCTQRWGLIPSFDKSERPDNWRMFNARSETLSTSPVFKRLLMDRRCAVPVDGFFEWTADEIKPASKQPWYVCTARLRTSRSVTSSWLRRPRLRQLQRPTVVSPSLKA